LEIFAVRRSTADRSMKSTAKFDGQNAFFATRSQEKETFETTAR
jgi:hypothetical protein